MRTAVISAVVTAAVSTVGDYLWANVLPHGQPVYWFAHAIVLFLTIGACLGLPSRRPLAGAAGAVAIGCLATAGFWILRPVAGYLGLQNHDPGDVVWFKEVSVRSLPSAETS